MAKVADDQARKQRAARIAQAETAASRQRNGDAADEDAGDDGKGQDEEAVLVDIDQVSLDFVVLGELPPTPSAPSRLPDFAPTRRGMICTKITTPITPKG